MNRYWLFFTIAFIGLFVAAYWIPLKGMADVWLTSGDYSYGFIIPPFSLYLFWDMRHKSRGLTLKSSWRLLPLLILFVLISIYGILGSSGNVSRPATIIVFILLFAFVLGINTFKRFALPLCFLIFMVPLPAFLDRTFGVFLKSVSSRLGVLIIQLCGLSVFRSGNVIDLGVTQLQVADACSGLRFVFPLLAIGIAYAYFFEKVAWKSVFCVVATIPIAIITNGIRIGLTGILTNFFGPEMAVGFFHEFSGFAIFMAAFAFLFFLGRILRWFPPKKNKKTIKSAINNQNATAVINVHPNVKYAFVFSFVILLLVYALSLTTRALPPVKLKNGINAFPLSFKGWEGRKQVVDPDIINRSGAEEAFLANYQDNKNDEVSLYIGYRSSSFLENEKFFHSPTVCLPSSGWKNVSQTLHKIKDISFGDNFTVTQMVIERMDYRELVYFWFQTKDSASYSKNINRFHLALHAIRHDNTNDLFIRLISPIQENESIAQVQTRMDKFAQDMMDTLNLFLKKNLVTK